MKSVMTGITEVGRLLSVQMCSQSNFRGKY